MKPFFLVLLISCTTAALVSSDAEPAPGNSTLVLEDSFDRAELGEGWTLNTGSWEIVDGTLQAKEIPADEHSAAARRVVETGNAVYELRFRFTGDGEAFHFGFDPAPGELDKRGHLFSVIVTPDSWKVMKHVDKARPKEDGNETLAQEEKTFPVDEWHTLRLTTRGPSVTATINGEDALKASHPTFGVRKPALVFRCVGDGVEVDDLKVWTEGKE
jgi:hypothetical protein